MNKSSFLTKIGGHAATLADVVRNGVNNYPIAYSNTIDIHSRRTTASVIHDQMIHEGIKLLPPSDFKLLRSKCRRLFSYQNTFLIQFKKLKPNLKTSNYPTKQAELFEEFGQVDLPGIEGSLPLFTVGYVPRPNFEGIEGIFVTLTMGKVISWSHRLDDSDEQPSQIFSIQPNPTTTPYAQKRRIRRNNNEGDSREFTA